MMSSSDASESNAAADELASETLPFPDRRDFGKAQRGVLGRRDAGAIRDAVHDVIAIQIDGSRAGHLDIVTDGRFTDLDANCIRLLRAPAGRPRFRDRPVTRPANARS